MKRVMLIGKNSNLARAVLTSTSLNHEVFGLGREALMESYGWSESIVDKRCEAVVLLAGMTKINKVEANRSLAYEINYKAPVRMIHFLNDFGIRCLFVSSSSVFGKCSEERYEDSIKSPDSYYGLLKSLVEDEIMMSGLNTVVRLTKVFRRDSILNEWRYKLTQSQSIRAFTNHRVSPISRVLFAEFVNRFATEHMPGIYHITADRDLNYFQLALEMSKFFGIDNSLIKPELLYGDDGHAISVLAAQLHVKRRESVVCELSTALPSIIKEAVQY